MTDETDAAVRWVGCPEALRAPLLAALRPIVGRPELRVSQDETVTVLAVAPGPAGLRVTVEYVFDRDFASQYDQTERWEGELTLAGFPAPGAPPPDGDLAG